MVDLENKVHQQSTEMEVRKKKLKELENENERLKSLLDSAQVMKEPLNTINEQQMNQTMIIEPRTLPSQLLFENSQQTEKLLMRKALLEYPIKSKPIHKSLVFILIDRVQLIRNSCRFKRIGHFKSGEDCEFNYKSVAQ